MNSPWLVPSKRMSAVALCASAAVLLSLTGCASDRRPGSNPDGGTPGSDSGSGNDATVATGDLVDPNCIDGQYSETLPTGEESISDLAYDSSNLVDSALRFLDRRYPNGAEIISGCLENDTPERCVERWYGPSGPSDETDFLLGLSTAVHEGGHLNDLGRNGSGFGTYWVTNETVLTCEDGDSIPRGGMTFARSEIYSDEFQSGFRPCESLTDNDCDNYALIYLDPASPTGTLGPSQGFSSVMEEALQYVNSLATGHSFRDQIRGARSERDGILAFLWYVERYLHKARIEFPDAYAFISGSACWREVILTIWGRAWLYLEHTEGETELEVDADIFMNLVRTPVLVEEIERIRTAHGCT